jgi:hypothetical protein
LSLNAEKNWHQNSGAKRRVSSKDEDMVRSGLRLASGSASMSLRRGLELADRGRIVGDSKPWPN